jgi:hypothetical protein
MRQYLYCNSTSLILIFHKTTNPSDKLGEIPMAENKESRNVVFLQPWYTTAIQIIAILATIAVLLIMYLQLRDIRHEQSMALRPYLHLDIDIMESKTQLTEIWNAGKADEIWGLGYYIENVGKYPARDVFFKTDWSTSRKSEVPSSFDNDEPQLINPGLRMLAIIKTLPRSEVLRVTGKGDKLYRHFYVQYKDKDGRSYFSSATWILSHYRVGAAIRWELVTNDGN